MLSGRGLFGGDEEQPAASPLPEAIAETLREHYALMQEPHDLRPGTLVTYKPGLDQRRKDEWDRPMLLVDGPDACVGIHAGMVRLLDWMPDGTSRLVGTDLRLLMPWSPPAA